MNKISYSLLALFFSSTLLASATINDKYDIELYEFRTNITQKTQDFMTSDADAWEKWKEENGDWSITIDKQTKTPMMAIGKPIPVGGFSFSNTDNAGLIAEKFIKSNSELFNVNFDDLELKFIKEVAGKYYVHYVQKYGRYEVLNSEVSIRINKKAEVFNFKMTVYNDINIPAEPALTPVNALMASTKGIEFKRNKQGAKLLSNKSCDDKLYILPKKSFGSIDYHLVYKTKFTADGIGQYQATVDANTGKILERKNQFHNVAANIEATTLVRKSNPTVSPIEVPMEDLRIPIKGKIYYTDKEGKLTLDIDEPVELSFPVEGKYAQVQFQGGSPHSNSVINMTLQPGDNFITLNNDNSNVYERFAVYHINHMHNYMLEIDPSLTCLEDKFTVIYHADDPVGGGTNAYSMGYTIGYTSYLDTTELYLAESADVLYHEYGHSVNTNFYKSLGTDMVNGACHEALADLNAALATDFSKIGYGAFTGNPTKVIRDLDNTNKYPDDIEEEAHHDSQILSGAFWDIREEKGIDYTAHLSHFSRYGLPDDPDTGVAFGEWLVESLIVDDDNGDLSDGSPNFDLIIESFAKHNITLDLVGATFIGYPLISDNYEQSNSLIITAPINTLGLPIKTPEKINFVYTTDNFISEKRVALEKTNSNSYQGEVDLGDSPIMFRYYYEKTDGTVLSESSKTNVYDYCVANGYKVIAHDDFETDKNYNITNSDDAVQGFRHGETDGIDVYGMIVKAKNDMSKHGTKAISTGFNKELAEKSKDMEEVISASMMTRGRSEFITEDYDLGNYKDIVISFYLHNLYFDTNYGDDANTEFKIQYAFGDSEDWQDIYVHKPEDILYYILGIKFSKEEIEDAFGVWRRIYEPVSVPEGMKTVKLRIYSDIKLDEEVLGGVSMTFDELMILGNPKTVGIEDELSMSSSVIYPNPANQTSKINFISENTDHTNIALYTIEGQLLNRISTYTAKGLNTISITDVYPNFKNLSAGTYLIRIEEGTNIETIKMIKQ